MKQFFSLFTLSMFGFLFISAFLFAENDEVARLEALQGIINQNTKKLEFLNPKKDLGNRRLSQEDIEAALAIFDAAEKFLAEKNISEESRIWTLKRKTFALMILAYEKTPRFFPLLTAVIDELDGEKDCRSLQIEAERHVLLIGSVLAVNPIDKKKTIDIKSLAERIISFAKENPGQDADDLIVYFFGKIRQIPQQYQRDKRLAVAAPLFIQYFDETNQRINAQMLMADARRAMLSGHQMLLGGFDLDGKMFDTAKLKDKVILVQFWGTWCVPCREEIPTLIELYEKYHSKGFEIIGINTAVKGDERPEKVRQFIAATPFGDKQKTIPWQILHEGIAEAQTQKTITKYYGIAELPVLILIGRDGIVSKIHPLLSTLDAEIRAALNAVELTEEEQNLANAARKKREAEEDKAVLEQLKLIEKK